MMAKDPAPAHDLIPDYAFDPGVDDGFDYGAAAAVWAVLGAVFTVGMVAGAGLVKLLGWL